MMFISKSITVACNCQAFLQLMQQPPMHSSPNSLSTDSANMFWTPKFLFAGDRKKATAVSVLSNSTGPISFVKATPAQLHFHTHSEHIISGASYPLEMHIVHFIKPDQLPACPAPNGCPVVLGVFFALTDREDDVSPELRRLIEAMPLNEGQSQTVKGIVDVNALLPSSRTYFTYEGSLTTPPCT